MKAFIAILLLLALPAAAQDTPEPAESPKAFKCRQQHAPEVRSCTQTCETAFLKAEQADARWECIQVCTMKGLWTMAACRQKSDPGTDLASR